MKKSKTISPDPMFEQLQQAFQDFQIRADKLSQAYESMQEDFKKVNLELDQKNKEIEVSLKKQAEIQTYLNSILESMNNGVIGIDTVGIITQFNKAASEITGYEPAAVIGRKYKDAFPGNSLSDVNVTELLDSGKEHIRDEKVMWHKSGNPVSVSFQSALLKDQKERELGAVEIFSDISRIKALEEEMRHKKTMAALGEMAATVVHEIRNPLGAMGVWASLLNRDLQNDEPKRDIVLKIINALARLNRIVSNLLVYCRPIRSELRKVLLQDVLTETVNFVDIEAERSGKQIKIIKKWNKKSPLYVSADPEKLQQLIMNLCFNSVQAMPEGGTLTVACNKPEKSDLNFISFSVIDTGIGIENERIDQIFDPFHTTKENGTGLGLAIVKKFIDYHSGYIKVKSKVNEGTAIKVFLPQIKEEK